MPSATIVGELAVYRRARRISRVCLRAFMSQHVERVARSLHELVLVPFGSIGSGFSFLLCLNSFAA